jgi:hypothetical protein
VNDARKDWYLKEWLSYLGQTGVWLQEETNWTPRISNQLINRKTRWNRDHLRLAARLLRIEPFELLLHPSEAIHLRKLKASNKVLKAVASND